jgi:DNA-binding response OmpR family regulator
MVCCDPSLDEMTEVGMADIIVVDDEPLVSATLADALSEYGKVTCISRHEHARSLLESHTWDLAIIDVSGSGIELADLAADMGTPSMLITGCLSSIEALRRYGFPCTAKPFKLRTFGLNARMLMLQVADGVLAVKRAAATMRHEHGSLNVDLSAISFLPAPRIAA